MKQRLAALSLVLFLAAPAAAGSQSESKLNVTLRIIQGVTQRHPHPPEGDVGDVFSVDLTLFTLNDGDFDAAKSTRVGNMNFSYLLHGSCSVVGTSCRGNTDITTVSKLPGGTITAVGNKVPIRTPFVLTIRSGTGRYAGAKGTVIVAPDGAPKNIYNITLP
jgi:hypothetical protein